MVTDVVDRLDSLVNESPLASRYQDNIVRLTQAVQQESRRKFLRADIDDPLGILPQVAALVLKSPDPALAARQLSFLSLSEVSLVSEVPLEKGDLGGFPTPKPTPKIYRFVLRKGATAAQRRYYRCYIQALQQKNPGWILTADRPLAHEATAVVLTRQQQHSDLTLGIYQFQRDVTAMVNDFSRSLSSFGGRND